MPRWAIALTVIPLGICLGCVVVGVIFVRRLEDNVVPAVRANISEEMAMALSGYVSRRIEARALATGGLSEVEEIGLRATDLSVNTVEAPGEVGIETGPDGTAIYGIETRISPTGIMLFLPGVTYSAVPVVDDGRIELTEIEAGENVLGFIFSDESFEQAIEGGINDALVDHGLTPVALSLRSGMLTIQVEPCACPSGPDGIDASPLATKSDPRLGIGEHNPHGRVEVGAEGELSTRDRGHAAEPEARSEHSR